MKMIHSRTWMRSLLISVVTSLIGLPVLAEQSTVVVNVNGLRSQEGNIIVCLWRQQDEGFPLCSSTASFEHITAEAVGSTVTVTFQNIPAGDYAISAFHDENQDGSVNRGFMGRPEEGIAFSNMNSERRERPSFERAKFALNGEQTISLSLIYF
jgi:uncharacterized protein (DUF2141 family)